LCRYGDDPEGAAFEKRVWGVLGVTSEAAQLVRPAGGARHNKPGEAHLSEGDKEV
jgi:hypothetical protein